MSEYSNIILSLSEHNELLNLLSEHASLCLKHMYFLVQVFELFPQICGHGGQSFDLKVKFEMFLRDFLHIDHRIDPTRIRLTSPWIHQSHIVFRHTATQHLTGLSLVGKHTHILKQNDSLLISRYLAVLSCQLNK